MNQEVVYILSGAPLELGAHPQFDIGTGIVDGLQYLAGFGGIEGDVFISNPKHISPIDQIGAMLGNRIPIQAV